MPPAPEERLWFHEQEEAAPVPCGLEGEHNSGWHQESVPQAATALALATGNPCTGTGCPWTGTAWTATGAAGAAGAV